jgi:hypothetical protein
MLVRKDANRANPMIVTLSNTRRSGLRCFLYAFRNRVVSVRAVQMPAEQARRADRRRVVKCHASQGHAHSSDTGSHAGVKKAIRPCLLHILECVNKFVVVSVPLAFRWTAANLPRDHNAPGSKCWARNTSGAIEEALIDTCKYIV